MFTLHQRADVVTTSIATVQGLAIQMMLSVEGSAERVSGRWIDSLVCSLALREGVCNPVPHYQCFLFLCISQSVGSLTLCLRHGGSELALFCFVDSITTQWPSLDFRTKGRFRLTQLASVAISAIRLTARQGPLLSIQAYVQVTCQPSLA